MNAARSYSLVPSLVSDGVVLTMNGDVDVFQAESLQVMQYVFATGTFSDVGVLIADYES